MEAVAVDTVSSSNAVHFVASLAFLLTHSTSSFSPNTAYSPGPTMSDSEDDFMSDKFLVDAPPPEPLNYSARRAKESLKSQRSGQAKNQLKLKDLEEQRRREGLETSLFERFGDDRGKGGDKEEAREAEKGGNKAMEMMMKMGWKVGQGLGKKRSPSPPLHLASSSRGGIGSKRPRLDDGQEENENGHQESLEREREREPTRPRNEPIRISLWARRKGLSARSPSPPPLPLNTANRNPDALDTAKMEQLGRATEGFRDRQRVEWAEKERERKGKKARELLVEMDREKGVKVCVTLLHLYARNRARLMLDNSSIHYTSSPPIRSARSPAHYLNSFTLPNWTSSHPRPRSHPPDLYPSCPRLERKKTSLLRRD